jgi:hypothetical protein
MGGFTPHLDEILSREQCAAWLGVAVRYLAEDAMSGAPKIPAFKPSHKVVRYHPRTILAKMAFDAGVPLQIIAASYGATEATRKL